MSGRWPPVVFWIFEQWIGVTMLRKGRLRLPGADFALFKSTFPGIPSATSKWTWKCGSQTFKRCERACCGGYVFINNTWQSTPLECVWNEILFGLCLHSWCQTFKSQQAEFSWLLWTRWVSLKVQLYLPCTCICQSSYLHCCIWICPSSHLSQVSHSHQVTHTQTGKIV